MSFQFTVIDEEPIEVNDKLDGAVGGGGRGVRCGQLHFGAFGGNSKEGQ